MGVGGWEEINETESQFFENKTGKTLARQMRKK